MKVGIITINDQNNYGNRLQNYATQQVLKSIGCSVETIRNTTPNLSVKEKRIKKFIKKIICNLYWNVPISTNRLLNNATRYVRFNKFTKKYISQSNFSIDKYNIPSDLSNRYDYFVCGSDQVWNPNFVVNSEIEFLTFAKKEQRIAYSASFGVSEIEKEKETQYTEWLNGIDCISVREDAGAEIVRKLTGREVIVLVDPTMMLSKDEWLKICSTPKIGKDKKYILTYFLGEKDESSAEKIKKISKDNNYEIIDLLDINDKNNYGVDPGEFVSLINNAELMCTDSFHGVVFSLIMKTPFIVFNRKDKSISMHSRLETLLSKFDMMSRLENNINYENKLFDISFENVDKIIEEEKEKAINYLKNSLNIK